MKNMIKMVSAVVAIAVLAMTSSVFATATNDQTVGSAGYAYGLSTPVVMTGICDFTATAGGAADVFKVINIPAGFMLLNVQAIVTTTNTTAMTFNVGDSAGTNAFIQAANGSAITTNGMSGAAMTNKLYTAKDYISVQPVAAAATGVIKVRALVVPQ